MNLINFQCSVPQNLDFICLLKLNVQKLMVQSWSIDMVFGELKIFGKIMFKKFILQSIIYNLKKVL